MIGERLLLLLVRMKEALCKTSESLRLQLEELELAERDWSYADNKLKVSRRLGTCYPLGANSDEIGRHLLSHVGGCRMRQNTHRDGTLRRRWICGDP